MTQVFNTQGIPKVSQLGGGGGGADGYNIIAAGTQTAGTTGTIVFSNSNGITFGMSNSSIVTASHDGLLSVAFSADASSTFQTLSFQNSNGVSFSNNGGAVRVTHALQFTSNTSAITSAALHTSASRVINVVAATNNTGGGTASLSSNVSFSAANGLTFYTSAGNAVVGSYTVPTVTNSSWSVSDAASSGTVGRLAFTNLNGVTLSLSTGAGGSHTIVGSHNALTSQSNQAFSAAGGSSAFQTLSYSDNAYASWTNNAGQVALTELRGSFFAASNTTQGTSGAQNLDAITFAGAGIASVGITNGSVVISVPSGGGAGDGGVFAGVSTGGNTAGSTGTVSTGNFVLVGSNGITLSQSTGAAGSAATVTVLGMQSTLSMFALVPLAELGGPIPFIQSSFSLGQNSLYIYPVLFENAVSIDHIRMPVFVTNQSSAAASVQKGYTYQFAIYTRNSTNATVLTRHYSTSYTMAASHNSNASWMLSMITAIGNSTSYNTLTASSAGINLSSSLHGPRELVMPVSSLFRPGEYWMAIKASTSSVGAGGAVLNFSNLGMAYQTFNRPGQVTNATNSGFYQGIGMGTYSATTASPPDGISATQINQLGSIPILFAATGTV